MERETRLALELAKLAQAEKPDGTRMDELIAEMDEIHDARSKRRAAKLVEWVSASCSECGCAYSHPPNKPDPGPPVHACGF